MKFLKGLLISFLGFLLFLSLSIFGWAFAISSTALNADFIGSQIEAIDASELIEEAIAGGQFEVDLPEELMTSIIDTVDKLEDPVKAQIGAAIGEVYDYMLGRTETPDLAGTLGDTFLNSEFVGAVLEEVDLSLLAEEMMSDMMSEEGDMDEFGTELLEALADLEPEIKAGIVAAVDPIFDYLLGETQSIDAVSTLRSTLLTSEMVSSLIDELAASSLASEFVNEMVAGQVPEEMEPMVEHLDDIIAELIPTITDEIAAAADPLLDYLLGESQSLDITISLQPLVDSLSEQLDAQMLEIPPEAIAPYFASILTDAITESIPAEAEHLADDVITEEWVEGEVNAAIDPVLDYLLGRSPTLSVTISLESVVDNLRDLIREEFLESPPSEFEGLPQDQLEEHFDEYFDEVAGDIPLSVEIDETMLGTDLPEQIEELLEDMVQMIPASINLGEMLGETMPVENITEALADIENQLSEVREGIADGIATAEEQLAEIKPYIGYFQLGYKIAIGVIVLLVAAIVLLNREVVGSTRKIGTIFLTFGLPWFVGILVGKQFIERLLLQIDVPIASLQEKIPTLINNSMAPMQNLSLGFLIGGVVLIVISFLYPRWRHQQAEEY
jgi:hypothetical protein